MLPIREIFSSKKFKIVIGAGSSGKYVGWSGYSGFGTKSTAPFCSRDVPRNAVFFPDGSWSGRHAPDRGSERATRFFDSVWNSLPGHRWHCRNFYRPRVVDEGGGRLAFHDALRKRILHRRAGRFPRRRAGSESWGLCRPRARGDFPV